MRYSRRRVSRRLGSVDVGKVEFGNGSGEGCTNPERQVVVVNKFSRMVSNICRPSGWNLLHVTFKEHRILRWPIDFWKIYVPLIRHNLSVQNYSMSHYDSLNFLLFL